MATDPKGFGTRLYSRPVLTMYGDIAKLTKGGIGSTPETKSQNSKQQRP